MDDVSGVPRTLLVTLDGRDRPGVTSAVFDALSPFPVEVLDIEQVVLRGRLVLGLLLTAPRDDTALLRAARRVGESLGMAVEVAPGQGDNERRRPGRAHITVLGVPLRPRAIAAVAGRVADRGGNIDRIVRMARYPVTAIELEVSGTDPEQLRLVLSEEAVHQQVDIAVQPAGLHRRAMRLVVMDVDSTLLQGEVVEALSARAGGGVAAEVSALTDAAMRGDIDFADSLGRRVALLAGLPVAVLDEVYDGLLLAPGARTLVRTLKRLGYRFAVVSGGFSQITDRLVADLGIDYAEANRLEVRAGRLTGRLVGPVLDRAGKAEALRRFAARCGVTPTQTVAIGDGANDIDMLAAAGLGVAFNARPVVRAAADTAVSVPYLDAVLFLLGISREEVEAADAAAGMVTRRV